MATGAHGILDRYWAYIRRRGIVYVQDLIVVAEYVFEEVPNPMLIAHLKFDEAEGITAQKESQIKMASFLEIRSGRLLKVR